MRISDWSSDVCSSDLDHYLLERMQGHDIAAKARVARTFQNIRLFPKMTVLENLIVAQHNKLMRASGFTLTGLFGWKGYRKAEVEAVEPIGRASCRDRVCSTGRSGWAAYP